MQNIAKASYNFIQVALRVSLISEHEDVIPSEFSTACQGTTVETTQMLPPVHQSMEIYPY